VVVLDKKKTVLIFLGAMVLLITLFFGLKPRGFRFRNQAELLEDGSGISFTDVGMAYSRGILAEIGISDSFCIAFTMKPYSTGRQLSRVLSLVDGKGRTLLQVDQWRTGLDIMIWDADGAKIGKIGFENGLNPHENRSLVLSITREEMRLSVDEEAGAEESRGIDAPAGLFRDCRLLIGLSPTGRDPWRGEMKELGFFRGTVSTKEIEDFEDGGTRFSTGAFASAQPAALFYFNERSGRTVGDQSGNGWNLQIPAFPRLLKHEVLVANLEKPLTDFSQRADMIVNLVGFIPLGVFFSLCFGAFMKSGARIVLLTVCCAFAVSLGIELLQVFIPTRTSQLPDLVLNTLGALIGAAAVHLITRRRKEHEAS
jgi:VanZ family protein